MTSDRSRPALLILQWVLGLVILAEAAAFAFSPGAAQAFAKTGMPNGVRLVLGWGEIATVTLFLIPRTVIAGGWLLITVLGFAIVLHLLHGWWDVGSLVIDATAAWAVMDGKKEAV